jgi:hypothetical protein
MGRTAGSIKDEGGHARAPSEPRIPRRCRASFYAIWGGVLIPQAVDTVALYLAGDQLEITCAVHASTSPSSFTPSANAHA